MINIMNNSDSYKPTSSASEIVELEKELGKRLESMARSDRSALDEVLMDVLLTAQSSDAHPAGQQR